MENSEIEELKAQVKKLEAKNTKLNVKIAKIKNTMKYLELNPHDDDKAEFFNVVKAILSKR